MKKLLFISVIILVLSHSAISQQKGDNIIVISEVTFKEAVNQLLDKGYSINKIDSNFKTIRTEKRDPQKVGGFYFLDIRIKDSSMVLKGKYFLLDVEGDIENRGMKGSVIKETFTEMDNFAKSFNKPIEYKKQ